MAKVLKKGMPGPAVLELQKLLKARGYAIEPDGIFGTRTYQAVRAFQSQNMDQHGQPFRVEGEAWPLTWWSLSRLKPLIDSPSVIRYDQMPPEEAEKSHLGRAGLSAAIEKLKAGAREIGRDNAEPWVRKHL